MGYRLYLTVQVLALAFASVALIAFSSVFVQGRIVAAKDFACFDVALKEATLEKERDVEKSCKGVQRDPGRLSVKPSWGGLEGIRPTAQKRNARPFELDAEGICMLASLQQPTSLASEKCNISGDERGCSVRAWDCAFGRRHWDARDVAAVLALSIGPALVIWVLRRWVGWLVKPPAAPT